jgi:hypothetical protein
MSARRSGGRPGRLKSFLGNAGENGDDAFRDARQGWTLARDPSLIWDYNEFGRLVLASSGGGKAEVNPLLTACGLP